MAATEVPDTWEKGRPYEQFIGRWSRRVAPLFLSWMGIPGGRRWLDVGCGTGALSAAILDQCAPASVVGVEPSEGFLEEAEKDLAGRMQFHGGSAAHIPLDDASVDVSGLVLNSAPDHRAALAEMARVTVGGGAIGAYVWDYAGRMDLLRIFWDAAVDLDPAAVALDEGTRFPLCRPEALGELFTRAGLREVEVQAIDIAPHFASFEEYWRPFLGGQGPAPAFVAALDETARARLRDRVKERSPLRADGSIRLTARAWAVRGIVAS